jgi:hypothetical protein
MTNKISISIFFIFSFVLSACGQNALDNQGNLNDAKLQVKLALKDTSIHNVIDNRTLIIKDSEMAIQIVEPILFSIYGKNNIVKQKPYKINLVDEYWVVSGTLHSEHGGVFLIIIDARNSKVIRITHGK